MNSKRRAEMQRNCRWAPCRVHRRSADRIKADIPQYLQTEAERARFSGSVAFSMRVAASILLLITTAFVTLRLLETEPEHMASFKAAKPQLIPAVTHRSAPANAGAPRPQPQPLGEEVRLDIAQEIAVPTSSAPAPRVAAMPAGVESRQGQRETDQARDNGNTQTWATEVQEVTANAAGAMDDRAEPVQIAEMPPVELPPAREREEAVAPAPPAAAAEAAPLGRSAQTDDATRKKPFGPPYSSGARSGNGASARSAHAGTPPPEESFTITASAPSLMSEAHASEISLAQKPQVFGISVDPKVFLEMKTTLQKGNRPAEASRERRCARELLRGPPDRAPRRVSLEVEASPAPVEADGDHAVLRFTIDTPRIKVGPRESTPPAAAEARLDIQIDPKAVATSIASAAPRWSRRNRCSCTTSP